jgi:hypothetical protein
MFAATSGEKHAAAQARNTPDIFTVTIRPSAAVALRSIRPR